MKAERKTLRLYPDNKRVLLQFFYPGNEQRVKKIIARIIELNEQEIKDLLNQVMNNFGSRHKNIEKRFLENYHIIEKHIPAGSPFTEERKILTGAYFSKEYSIEAASLFNPSIVPAPDGGRNKFIVSFRATGEGHISSIEFRGLVIDANKNFRFSEPGKYISTGKIFEYSGEHGEPDYTVGFDKSTPVAERILFPFAPAESHGMEDARFVRFFHDNNTFTYFGTYTAYDGHNISIRLIETEDFLKFNISTIRGDVVKDKGMAIFPRMIHGYYHICSRLDGENLYIMKSANIHKWEKAELLRIPLHPWEFIQIGNCGSPIETDQGWILLTHGVGPVRTYVISALLLQLDDPSKVIGYLPEPLISPEEEEREGYVPNVVYSCGGILFEEDLIIPYAMSDSVSGIASVGLKDLLRSFIRI